MAARAFFSSSGKPFVKVDFDEWYAGIAQALLAFFGGLIGALMRREVSSWQTALLAACGAGFVGFLVAKFCRATGVSEDLTYAFVGVSGWLGAARTIDYLEKLIENRLGARFPRRTTDTPVNTSAAPESAKVETLPDDKKANSQ